MGANTLSLAEFPADIDAALAGADRRLHARLSAAQIRWLKKARLKYGPVVRVLDVSCGGLQIETAGHPLEPGGTLAIELGRETGTVVVPASVVRCYVAALLPHTVYRGALAFKRLIDVPGAFETPAVSAGDGLLALTDTSTPITEQTAQRAWHKLVVRYLDGRLRKGFAVEFIASSGYIHVLPKPDAPETSRTTISLAHLKAIFFVRDFSGDPAHIDPHVPGRNVEERNVLVTFGDGETLAGVTTSYDQDAAGFFLRPLDAPNTHTRVFVVSRAIRHVQFV